jgi:RNA polymerase sigma-70 factor, ECF subfamily
MDKSAQTRAHDEEPATAAQIDRAATFEVLASQHLDASYRLARLILSDPIEAEDATHDAFLAAWRGWSQLREPEHFDAWFGRILVNTCRNQLRRAHRQTVIDVSGLLELPDVGRSTEDGVVNRMELERAFAALSPDHRTVLALRFYSDLPVEQIAARLSVRSGTVKSRLHHALRALNAVLQAGRREDHR